MEIKGIFTVDIKDKNTGKLLRHIESPNTVVNNGVSQVQAWLDRPEYVVNGTPLGSTFGEQAYCAGEMSRIAVAAGVSSHTAPYDVQYTGNKFMNCLDDNDNTCWYYVPGDGGTYQSYFRLTNPIHLKALGFLFTYDNTRTMDGHMLTGIGIRLDGCTVAGAGTSAFNSTEYIRESTGIYNGYKYYKQYGLAYYLFANAAGTAWILSTSLGGTPYYQTSSLTTNPYDSGAVWSVGSAGSSNAPTVTEGCATWRNPMFKESAATEKQTSDSPYRTMAFYDRDTYYGYTTTTGNRYYGNMTYRMRSFEGVEGLYTTNQQCRWYGYIPYVKDISITEEGQSGSYFYHSLYEMHVYQANPHPQNPYALALGTDNGSILPLAATNTALGAPVTGAAWKCSSVTQNSGTYAVTYSRTIMPEEANGVNFNEIGLMMNMNGHLPTNITEPKLAWATNLFARSIFSSPWSKTQDQTVTINYTVTVN